MTDTTVARPPASRFWLGRVVVLAVIVLVALVVAGARANHKTHTVGGDFLLTDNRASWTMDSPCSGSGGFADVTAGLPVTVTDGAGKVIGTGELGSGVADSDTTCSFPISVPKVPQVDFYTVAVGSRGSVTRSKADMAHAGWQVELSLGS